MKNKIIFVTYKFNLAITVQKSTALYKLLGLILTGQCILYHYSKTKEVLREELSDIVVDEALKQTLQFNPRKPFT